MSSLSIRIAEKIEALVDGVPGKALAERAERISEGFRASRPSSEVIRNETDAVVYALMRMPATAAAVEAVLDAFGERVPDFSPRTILDAGAGPGTAGLIMAEIWPDAAPVLCDSHPDFLKLAQRLLAETAPALADKAAVIAADIARPATALPEADLVIASYSLTELDDAAYQQAALRLWAAAKGALVIIEPGRPRDYHRLMAFRQQAIGQGARIAAPCPHAEACPLAGEDWCHFSVRLPRSRAHLRLKGGALGYEDEKFSYLVLVRPDIDMTPPLPRILSMPDVMKHEIRLKLCETDGTVGSRGFGRRHPEFSRIRRARWGKCVDEGDVNQHQ